MKKQEERRYTVAVVAGWAQELLPRNSEMLVLLGSLQVADEATFDTTLERVKRHGETLESGFTTAVERYVATTLEQIRKAEKELALTQ